MRRCLLSLGIILSLTCSASAEDLWQSYELAKASDPQLQSAQAQRQNAQEQITLARSALLPQVSASLGYQDSQFSRPAKEPNSQIEIGDAEGRTKTKNLGAQVNQTIYDHANYTRLKASRKQAEAADQTFKAAEQALLVRVADAYFRVLTTQDSLSSSQAEEKAVGRQLEQAEQRFNVGLTAITDVHEARARHDGAIAAAILSENALDDARAALTELTGKTIEEVASVKESIPLEAPTGDWQSWVDKAMQSSPTLSARSLESQAAEQQIQTAKAARFPTVGAQLGYNKDSSEQRNDLTLLNIPINANRIGGRTNSDSSGDSSQIGITVNVPLFSGFATSARIRQAVLDSEISKDRLEQERRAITRSTRNAFRSVIAGVSEVKARQQALVSAKSALEATEAGFEVGTRTIVDVLLSQQVLFQAQRDYSQARHNFLVNGLKLKSSAGTITPEDLRAVNGLLRE
jgi:outer membrane protein